MAKQKKRLAKMVEAVSTIMGSDHKARKLRKAKALARFIEKLGIKKAEIENEIASEKVKGKEAEEKEDQVRLLTKQIKKGKKILADMR
jgi:hypothetical protein